MKRTEEKVTATKGESNCTFHGFIISPLLREHIRTKIMLIKEEKKLREKERGERARKEEEVKNKREKGSQKTESFSKSLLSALS